MRPPGNKPRPTDSESDVLTTLLSMHMDLTRDQAQTHANGSCIFKCDIDKNKNNNNKKRRSAETLTRRLRPSKNIKK